ncbi:MAG: SDR family NAD(P)-dependent oxidoreductase [Actinomycetota bacterium]
MTGDISGKSAFVTGAASGLGRAIALRLATDGAHVWVADIAKDRGEDVVAEIRLGGGAASFVHCDVTDLDNVRAAAAEAGDVDILVNNAGFDRPNFFLQTEPSLWDDLIAVNLKGVLNCTYAFAETISERCRETGYGRIVNIASDAGRVGSMGEAVYAATKGGVIAFTKSMARELARDRVTVNAVCPGPAETPMTEGIKQDPMGSKMMDLMIMVTPFKRLVAPEEVADAVAYFAGQQARFVTGQVLSVSGGLTMSG